MADTESGTEAETGLGERRLTTREAADRLGVKPETVYAYVSRGQLTSRRTPGGRGSTFDAGEVEALLRRGRREAAVQSPGHQAPGGTTVHTGITLIDRDRYYYRGVDATALARRHGYEETAEWLWTGRMRPGIRFTAPEATRAAARRAVSALPAHSGPMDGLRVAAIAAAAADPLRFDLTEVTVLASARALIATLVDALPYAPGQSEPPRRDPSHAGGNSGTGTGSSSYNNANEPASPLSIAEQLWARLSPHRAEPAALRVLQTALVLLIDHDLAASTLAVRVAASARAHPYAAVSAGLGAADGPLHGAASGLAHRMLTEALDRGSAAAVVADQLRAGGRVPGLGHRIYPAQDPRAQALFGLLADVPGAADALAAAREVEATAAHRTELHANVDLALAVLTVSSGMPTEAGETMFAVGRVAGWIAHALEEYAERPLRMRPSGQYRGPKPPQPVP
ncbi:citrate synthase [Streptomyces zagrosensis]|uniref:citrate synthase (unknown stereospecificity) n=1 Tax=Streptomyces zagrosensis TaxID=1042984 RepID=A0A7W9V0T8_9ACTN|nr:citrate synthase [Streptomyces zagrosensis]MBB5937576.1 citrate synthase [Streptomyces zagrosensis]